MQCTVKHKIKQIQYFHKKYSFSELKSRDSISSSKFLGSFVGKRGKRSWGNHQNWTLCCLKSLPLRRNLWLYWKNERVCKECQTFCKNIKNCFGDCVVLLHNEKIKRDRQRHLATFCLFFYHLLFLLSSAFSILIYWEISVELGLVSKSWRLKGPSL